MCELTQYFLLIRRGRNQNYIYGNEGLNTHINDLVKLIKSMICLMFYKLALVLTFSENTPHSNSLRTTEILFLTQKDFKKVSSL